MKSGASKEESYDITQEVLVKMLESNLTLPREKIRSWMYLVAIRRYIDRYRREKRYQEILQREFFNTESSVSYDEESYEFLYEAIASLKMKFQLPLNF